MSIEILKKKEPGLDGKVYFLAILKTAAGGGVAMRDYDLDDLERRFRCAARKEGVRLPLLH